MGLHNLESEGIFDIIDTFSDQLDASQRYGWLDEILARYGSVPTAPFSTQAELIVHFLSAVRGMRFSFARRTAAGKLEMLQRIIDLHKERRLAIFIEYVDMPDMAATLQHYTVWKGVLFEVQLEKAVVCWHPDKEFQPISSGAVYRTDYSELGKRQRRRQTRESQTGS